jgi:hypothetical protein
MSAERARVATIGWLPFSKLLADKTLRLAAIGVQLAIYARAVLGRAARRAFLLRKGGHVWTAPEAQAENLTSLCRKQSCLRPVRAAEPLAQMKSADQVPIKIHAFDLAP